MTSRERILAAINYQDLDHIPLYCWCFGFEPPPDLRWYRRKKEVKHWYTMRLEHIHTLPEPWDINDDFKRVQTWLGLGVDDILDISLPWSIDPAVTVKDWREENILGRIYETPAGSLLQKVKKTEEQIPPGWVIQPSEPKIFEDFNLPRSSKFLVSEKADLPKLAYILQPPNNEQLTGYRARMSLIKKFTQENGVLVQGWSAFGMDGVVWLMGVENAITAAVLQPDFFQAVVDTVFQFDLMRTELMLEAGGIDMFVQRGWYSSTDFWSPALFRKYVLPNLKKLVKIVHQRNLKFAYVMTTGIMVFLEDLAEAGIDLLYFVDPEQDRVNLGELKEKLRNRFALAGGINSGLTLGKGKPEEIKNAVFQAEENLGRKGFILAPVDALFPDTPWPNVEIMLEAWRDCLTG